MIENLFPPDVAPVAPREGRVSRNTTDARKGYFCLVAPREGRVSRNIFRIVANQIIKSRPARGV